MGHAIYEQLKDTARRVAQGLPRITFYERHPEEVGRSGRYLVENALVQNCRLHLDESLLECAHGMNHCEAVARDAGAIVLVEGADRGMSGLALEQIFSLAVIAGLLHDVKRREQDHALLGSIEAERILSSVGMEKRHRDYVTHAIRNHEAFKATCDLDDEAGCLVSDALYDADKFRWGPENFTTTLWTMVSSNNTAPERLHEVFQEKMKGIERIKETFRTATGRRFGPEFIDQGLLIGNAIYEEMGLLLKQD